MLFLPLVLFMIAAVALLGLIAFELVLGGALLAVYTNRAQTATGALAYGFGLLGVVILVIGLTGFGT